MQFKIQDWNAQVFIKFKSELKLLSIN